MTFLPGFYKFIQVTACRKLTYYTLAWLSYCKTNKGAIFYDPQCIWGYRSAPPPFRPGNPALCGSCPLVTPYYCRLGDLLCYTCMLYLSTVLCVYACVFCVFFVLWVVFLYSFLLQYFDTVGWVFWPVKTVSIITYTVLEGTKTLHNPIQSSLFLSLLTSLPSPSFPPSS